MNMDKKCCVNICGVDIHRISFQETIEKIKGFINNGVPRLVVTCNIDHIIKLNNDADFKRVYKNASLVVPDGVPLLWAAKFLGVPLLDRVNGTDLFEKLCGISAVNKYRIFFLGGRPGAAEGAAKVLQGRYPGLQVVGVYSPPLGFENDEVENNNITDTIKNFKPDILFVGLGAPKQEKWIFAHKDEYRAPVSIGIGVSFELVAGMVRRAPLWMQRAGLEWFWRLMMEPGRLWKRYLIDDVQFFWLILKQKFGS